MNSDSCRKVPSTPHLLQILFIGLLSLTGCSNQPVPAAGPVPSADPSTSPTASPTPEAQGLTTKPVRHSLTDTQLTLYVGKAGKLARLGHNHLITAALAGQAWLDDAGTLHATATVPVTELVVDDPQQRAAKVAAGNSDYSSVPSAKNIRDTRANMLGPRVLDAQGYPKITARAEAPRAAAEFEYSTSGSLNTDFILDIKGVSHRQSAVLKWRREDKKTHWNARFTVSHQSLGMTPFSALGGALRVADDIDVELQGTLTGPFSFSSD